MLFKFKRSYEDTKLNGEMTDSSSDTLLLRFDSFFIITHYDKEIITRS